MSYNKPPPYSEVPQHQPGFTPATTYNPPPQGSMYPPMPQPQPQPMPMPMPPPPQQNTVIIHTTSPAVASIGCGPTRMICPSCRAEILTSVKHEPSTRTHCWALLLCLFICWPCVCLPYCMDSCQNANHYCPNCSAYIGTYQ